MNNASYEITLLENLDERWATWFSGLDLVPSQTGGTLLRGTIPDKAALHGVLNRIQDLNLTLVSLQRIDLAPHSSEKAG